jgi:hypothetical protein
MIAFDPTQFIVNNQDLFMTVGVVMGVGVFTYAVMAITVMLALRTMR